MSRNNLISQEEVDKLLNIDTLLSDGAEQSILCEIRHAILDSGKLSLLEWKKLRDKLREIEELIPHIDLIIKLKEKR